MSTDTLLATVRAAAEPMPAPAASAPAPVAQTPAPQADLAAARAEGEASGRAAGATEERSRIQAILGGEEAKTRPATARQLAFTTNMSPSDAAGFLAALPAEAASAPRVTRLDGRVPDPKVDAAAPAVAGPEADLAAAVDRHISAGKR